MSARRCRCCPRSLVALAALALALLAGAPPAAAQPMAEEPFPAPPSQWTPAPEPLPAKTAFEQLEGLLSSLDAQVRHGAVVQLGQLGDARAVPLLISVLRQDAEPAVRAAAAWSLGLLADPRGVEPVGFAAAHDPAPGVRAAAAAALPRMPAPPPPAPARTAATATTPPVPPSGQPAYTELPDYQSYQRRRKAGVLLTAIGGGVGMGLGFISSLLYTACTNDSGVDPGVCSTFEGTMITGFALLGVSLAVGVPLWATGERGMNRIRDEYDRHAALVPRIGLSVGPGLAAAAATWRF